MSVLVFLIVLADKVYKTGEKVTAPHTLSQADLLKIHLARCMQFWQKCPHAPFCNCKIGWLNYFLGPALNALLSCFLIERSVGAKCLKLTHRAQDHLIRGLRQGLREWKKKERKEEHLFSPAQMIAWPGDTATCNVPC